MIYVDMKLFNMRKTVDIKLDEEILVSELLDEIEAYFPIKRELSFFFSTRNKQLLNEDESLKNQGILGGDTLILIESEGDNNDFI